MINNIYSSLKINIFSGTSSRALNDQDQAALHCFKNNTGSNGSLITHSVSTNINQISKLEELNLSGEFFTRKDLIESIKTSTCGINKNIYETKSKLLILYNIS